MLRQLTDYFVALIACLIAFAGYQILAAPLLAPNEAPELTQPAMQPAATLDPRIAALFPPDAWQLRASHQVYAEAGTLLYEHSEQIDARKWRLYPVTMLVQGNEDGRMVLVDSQEAHVEFSGSIDSLDSGSSPISSGQLLGTVKIYSPPSTVGADDELRAEASDVRINRREIKTTEEVNFQYGSIRAKGKDLTIHLSGASGRGNTPVLDRFELIYLESLEMPLKEGGLWQPIDPPPGVMLARGSTPVPGLLSVICKCKLEFFFESLRMVLNGRRVELKHHIHGMSPDTIVCQRLDVRLARTTEKNSTQRWAQVVRHLEAVGSPTEPVVLQVPTLLSSGNAESIEIHFPMDQSDASIKLSGRNPVELAHRGMTMVVPGLAYHFSQSEPERIGRLDTLAGGTLILQPTELIPIQSIQWRGKLQILPQKNAHLLWIEGGIDGQTVDGRPLHADELQFTFLTATSKSTDSKKSTEGPQAIVPQQLVLASKSVTEKVKVDLPFVYLEQRNLNFWFEQLAPSANAENTSSASGPLTSNSKQTAQDSKRVQSRLISDSLGGQIRMAAGAIVGYDLSARDNIRVESQITSEKGPQPMVVLGDALRMIQMPNDQRLEIKGQTARIEIGDGFVDGPSIAANLTRNRLELLGGGEIRVPRGWLTSNGNTLDRPTDWTIPPFLRFKGYLVFDGKMMETTQVDVHGAMRTDPTGPVWQFAARGKVMQLVFERPINLMDANAVDATIEHVVLAGDDEDVIVDGSSWLGEARQSRHWLQTRRIDYQPITGNLFGAPGDYRMWSVRNASQGDSVPNFFGDAPLITSHLIYHEKFEGSVPNRQLDFVGAVRVGIGPAETWDQSMDVRRLEQPGRGQGILDCHRLRVYQSNNFGETGVASMPWEIEGLGGVNVDVNSQSGRFAAKSNRFNYTSSKDLLVLEGLPNTPVEISSLPGNVGSLFGSGQYSSISVRPRALEIVDARLLRATIQPPQNLIPPVAPPRFGDLPNTAPSRNQGPLNRLRSF